MERVKGIEPSQPAWKAGALPLSYTRKYFVKILRNNQASEYKSNGAEDGIRTRGPRLGKAMLYHWATSANDCYMIVIKLVVETGFEPVKA